MDPRPQSKGSSESPDSDERIEAKLALLEKQGLDPVAVERQLPLKYQRTR